MLKGAIRSRQLAASRNRMMADVPTADVVLVNPTHVAVALRYDARARRSPGGRPRRRRWSPQRIRESAGEHRVPLGARRPAGPRAATRSTSVGQEIPAELFAAVAQVLAFVISRRNRGQRGGEHRSPAPRPSSRTLPALAPAAPAVADRGNPSGPAGTGR